jgi:hypothetical protein
MIGLTGNRTRAARRLEEALQAQMSRNDSGPLVESAGIAGVLQPCRDAPALEADTRDLVNRIAGAAKARVVRTDGGARSGGANLTRVPALWAGLGSEPSVAADVRDPLSEVFAPRFEPCLGSKTAHPCE